MHYYTELYYNSCVRLGLNPQSVPGIDGFKVHIGNRDYFYRETLCPLNNVVSSGIAGDRFIVNRLLKEASLPVPTIAVVTKPHFLNKQYNLDKLRFPVVAKPVIHSSYGYHVVCDIRDKQNAFGYLNKYFQIFDAILFEEYYPNLKSYEIIVVYQKALSVLERRAATITGDGEHSLEELILIENEKRKQKPMEEQAYPIQLNEESLDIFNQLRIDFDSIIPKGREVPLRHASNILLGGDFKSLDLETIHPSYLLAATKAAQVLDLNYASINILCEDIQKPIDEAKGVIVSVTPNPCIIVNQINYQGKDINLSEYVVKQHKIRQQWALMKDWLTYPLLSLGASLLVGIVCLLAYWLHTG